MLLSLTTLMMTSCAKSMIVNDYCLVTEARYLTIEGLRAYDCLCSDEPVNPECK